MLLDYPKANLYGGCMYKQDIGVGVPTLYTHNPTAYCYAKGFNFGIFERLTIWRGRRYRWIK
ncbi:hypothetical protein GCM10023231_25950 [Olivibacter ginsenosidimutans]|uniref:Uncharacterized protein n=1 Tax=Olivibacter ginsenosidimutans TaxID=1176537 RepID=A0ABP9BJF9_9SPHI